ncbi:MAG TPA: hypothetical protein VGC18_06295 [Lacisediminihabitans sp.]|uniref:hypothetical protein n=1 Tax=Lacisediminihabitans sp. TaxID=2787631 RepID=UPI002EDB76C5
MTARDPFSDRTQHGLRRFRTGEGLRCLLCRLHDAGEDAWTHDPVAAELMQYTRDKYATLARRHDLDPWEAVTAAFHVMRAKSTREAADPWGVITHAVRITCIYEERAQGLLCSVNQARRAHVSKFHDPDRFTARAHPIVDDHPVLAAIEERYSNAKSEPDNTSTPVLAAVERAIQLLVLLGWPAEVARGGVEQICDALIRHGARHTALEVLRRDKQVRALLDIPSTSWNALLWVMLGKPEPMYAATNLGRGVLMRLLIGETVSLLLRDDALVEALVLASPGVGR